MRAPLAIRGTAVALRAPLTESGVLGPAANGRSRSKRARVGGGWASVSQLFAYLALPLTGAGVWDEGGRVLGDILVTLPTSLLGFAPVRAVPRLTPHLARPSVRPQVGQHTLTANTVEDGRVGLHGVLHKAALVSGAAYPEVIPGPPPPPPSPCAA